MTTTTMTRTIRTMMTTSVNGDARSDKTLSFLYYEICQGFSQLLSSSNLPLYVHHNIYQLTVPLP